MRQTTETKGRKVIEEDDRKTKIKKRIREEQNEGQETEKRPNTKLKMPISEHNTQSGVVQGI